MDTRETREEWERDNTFIKLHCHHVKRERVTFHFIYNYSVGTANIQNSMEAPARPRGIKAE